MKPIIFALALLGYLKPVTPAPLSSTTVTSNQPESNSLVARAISEKDFSTEIGPMFAPVDSTCRGHMRPDCDPIEKYTVDYFLNNRRPGTDCGEQCLFYTEALSGPAERFAGYVIWDSVNLINQEGTKIYQSIWELHTKEHYDVKSNPKLDCIFKDTQPDDKQTGYNGCMRTYFKSMSKAMALKCSGKVAMMSNFDAPDNSPLDGIWWQVEFPTLIDPKRTDKVTEIEYLQVPKKNQGDVDALDANGKKLPPTISKRGKYWPDGPGQEQLNKNGTPKRDVQPQSENPASVLFDKREGDDNEPLDDDEIYTYDTAEKIRDAWWMVAY